MNDLKVLEKLVKFPKTIFTVFDLGKILDIKDRNLRTVIYRLAKRGVIQKLGGGWYSKYGEIIIPEKVAGEIYYPSYLSLKTVLSKEGVVNQIPRQIYSVSPKKSYQIEINNVVLVYRQIKKELFFGFYKIDNQYVAFPEKAFLDLLYFVSRGVETVSFRELDLARLNKKKLQRWIKVYPESVKKNLKKIITSYPID